MLSETLDEMEVSQSEELADGFDTYRQYVTLKAHFNSKYNAKEQGKIPVPRQQYEKRRDKKFFQIIETRYKPHERNQIFLANFVCNKHLWVGEMLTETCIQTWFEWKGRIDRLEYQFLEDVKNSLGDISQRRKVSHREALKYLIKKPEDTHPLILRFVWGGMFGIESYLILSAVLDLKKVYAPHLAEDKLWSDFERKIERYTHFLKPKIDIPKFKQLLKDIVTE